MDDTLLVPGKRIVVIHLRGGNGGMIEPIDCTYVGGAPGFIWVDVKVTEKFMGASGIMMSRRTNKRRILNMDYVTSINEWYDRSKG